MVDVAARVAAIQARVGTRAPEHDAVPQAGAVGAYEAEALIRAVLPVREVQHWEDHGDVGWVCRETGEVLTPTG